MTAKPATPAGRDLRASRKRLGMTQGQLAEALGLENEKGHSRRTVSDWELGRRKIPGPVTLAVSYLLSQRSEG